MTSLSICNRSLRKIYFSEELAIYHYSVAFCTTSFFSADEPRVRRLILQSQNTYCYLVIPFHHQIHLKNIFMSNLTCTGCDQYLRLKFLTLFQISSIIGYFQSQSKLCQYFSQPTPTVLSIILNSLFIKLAPFRQLYDVEKVRPV